MGNFGEIGEKLGKYEEILGLGNSCICMFLFVFIVEVLKYFVFKILPAAQHGTGEEEDNQDLLPWESLPVLIEQLLYFMNRLTFQLNTYSVFISSASKYLLSGNEELFECHWRNDMRVMFIDNHHMASQPHDIIIISAS